MKFPLPHILAKIAHSSFCIVHNLILPSCCAHCRKLLKEQALLCDRCLDMIRPIVSCPLSITKKRSVAVHAISDYKDPIRSLIVAKRYCDIIASRELGDLIYDLTIFRYLEADYIIPVPLHWTRFARRGYNQAEQIARRLAKRHRVPMINALKRVRKTKLQAGLSAEERKSNLQDAFIVHVKDRQQFKNKHIVLVDDVLTTGSTIRSAARVLFEQQPASVTVIVAARVV